MSGNDRVDQLLAYREQLRAGCADRTSIGWKINLGIWSGLGLFAGALATGKVAQLKSSATCVLSSLLVLSTLFYVYWVFVVACRNVLQARKIEKIDSTANSLLCIDLSQKAEPSDCCVDKLLARIEKRKRQNSAWKWFEDCHSQFLQICITLLLVVLAIVMLRFREEAHADAASATQPCNCTVVVSQKEKVARPATSEAEQIIPSGSKAADRLESRKAEKSLEAPDTRGAGP